MLLENRNKSHQPPHRLFAWLKGVTEKPQLMDVEKTIEFLLNNQAKHDKMHAQANERMVKIEPLSGHWLKA